MYFLVILQAMAWSQGITDANPARLTTNNFKQKNSNFIVYKNDRKTDFAENSVLNTGKWLKLKVLKTGVYKLTFSELRAIGIEPDRVRVFGYGGGMLPLMNRESRFDDLPECQIFKADSYILFYAQSPLEWKYDESQNMFLHKLHYFSEASYYFISSDYDSGNDNLIQVTDNNSLITNQLITEFDDYAFHEKNIQNLLQSGSSWYGEKFALQTSYDFDFDFPNRLNEQELKLKLAVIAHSPTQSSFILSASNFTETIVMPSVSMNYESTFASIRVKKYTFVNRNNETIKLDIRYKKSSSASEAWLDYVDINAICKLKMRGEQMPFRSLQSVDNEAISEFQIETATDLTIWDISNPHEIVQIKNRTTAGTCSFKSSTSTLREFIAFTGNSFLKAEIVGEIENQNLHALQQVDYLIVSNPLFLSEAQELAEFHRTNSHLTVAVVSTEQIYNEFSSGTPDVSAIRDFVRMCYLRGKNTETPLKYLLLFGDGSYDNLSTSADNTNFIPTYQSVSSLSPTQSFVTDDFFGLLDETEGGSSGLLDIGIGRFPVKNTTEAQNVVNKVLHYASAKAQGDWRNLICFIADDADKNETNHMREADSLARTVKREYPIFNIDKIYLDAYLQQAGQRYPEVNTAINERIKRGALIVNYTGHGNEKSLTHEQVLTISDINSWANFDKMPVFMTATCEFSRFDNYQLTSAGEQVLLNPIGGGIALFTTTRLVYSSPNFRLNKNFYRFVFQRNSAGEPYRLGDIIRLTKVATGSDFNKRNFTLLGDPALQLAVPKFYVHTTEINALPVSEQTDTLHALDLVTIKGNLLDVQGQALNNFNGEISLSVFDKEKTLKTRGNDGYGILDFSMQNNMLYKGKASVSDGNFQFQFVVPKDISYQYGKGKLSYYAENEQVDAFGFFNNFMIGGSNPNPTLDTEGPQINLFMNETTFVDGGITDENPSLLASFFDESGINTAGTGIGHDITAVLDNNTTNILVLNDLYKSEANSYQRGELKYPFWELPEGEHSIRLKAWDIYNNSSEKIIHFVVLDAAKPTIKKLFNYPNPVQNETTFSFEHNRANEELKLELSIFSLQGKLVKKIVTNIQSDSYRNNSLIWDGKNEAGNLLKNGVYIYRLTVSTPENEVLSKSSKLLLLKQKN